MTGPSICRIPPPPSQELRKLNLTGFATKMVQATLKSPKAVPKVVPKKTIASVPDQPTNSKAMSKPREEIFAPGYLTDDEVRFGIMCSLNPELDRLAAVVGHEDISKKSILLFKPPFGAAGEPLRLQYPGEIHWERESSIRNLNRWREAILKHYMGLGLECDSGWHQLEKEFVEQACTLRHEQAQARSKPFAATKASDGYLRRPYSWLAITEDFNSCFSGRKLPGCKEPRPARKRIDLLAQHCRTQRDETPFFSTVANSPKSVEERRSAGSPGRPAIPTPKPSTPSVSPVRSALPTPEPKIAVAAPVKPQRRFTSLPKPARKRSSVNSGGKASSQH